MDLPTTLTYLLCAGSAIWIAAVLSRLRSAHPRRSSRYGLEATARHVGDAFVRLFSVSEEAFIARTAPASRELGRRFRRNRRQVFDLYLQQLKKEHDAATAELRRLAVRYDRPDLASVAVRRTIGFNTRYWVLRLQLAAGLAPTAPSVRWAAARRPALQRVPVSAPGGSDAGLQHTAVR